MVCSVNYSQTSFMKNREAGVIVEGTSSQAQAYLDFLDSVFQGDWAQATPYVVNQTYSAADMAIITSSSAYPVTIPPGPAIPGSYITPAPTPITGNDTVEVFTSPDYAKGELLYQLNYTKTSLAVHIYQITDDSLCSKILDLFNAGVNVTLLLSSDIYDSYDKSQARYCYEKLNAGGMHLRMTPSYYTYSHQKYWIIDGYQLGLSTGNWSPSDFNWPMPGENGAYPAYPDPNWQLTNRDFQIISYDPNVIAVFNNVFNNDYARGQDYTPNW